MQFEEGKRQQVRSRSPASGCSQRNLDARSRCARNPLRARLHLREAETSRPHKAKTRLEKAGLHTGGGRGRSFRGRTELSPPRRILQAPLLATGAVRLGQGASGRVLLHSTEAPLRSISALLPTLSSLSSPQTYAPWPVWRDSVTGPVRFAPLSRKQAARLWHKARRWDRETRRPGRHGGVIGRTALVVLYTLAFDFLNCRTGRLDPSLNVIAHKAGVCRRAVVNAVQRLRELGLLTWKRRCEEERDTEGRFRLRQRSNAYGLLPPSQWVGYRDTDPPPPSPDALGAPDLVPDPIEAAVAEITSGQRKAAVAALEADPRDRLALALAALGRALGAI
jgi:hypothetical protein